MQDNHRRSIVKRTPYSSLGYHVKRRREEHLLRRRKLARLIGFVDGKEGAVSIRMLEDQGVVDPPDLLDRVAVVLHLNEATIQELQEQDRIAAGEWFREVLKPIKPYLGLRTIPIPSMATIPENVIALGPDAIEEFTKEFARRNGLRVHAVLSKYISIEFDECGQFVGVRELGRDFFLR